MAKTFNNYFIHLRNTLRKKKKATSDNKQVQDVIRCFDNSDKKSGKNNK